jgi:inhibitor of cysteine peptidase
MLPVRLTHRVISMRLLSLAVLLAIVFSPQAVFAAARVITDADQGGRVHLKVGETLEIRLKSNPSTGYMWYVHPRSTPLLKLAGQSQSGATEQSGNQRVGQPIFQIFKFAAQRRGSGVLLLHYIRSWEKPAPDEKQFRLHVFIE